MRGLLLSERASLCPAFPAFGVGISLLCLLVVAPARPAAEEPSSFSPVSAAARHDALRRARVREEADVAARDLYNGPTGALTFRVDEEITCDFVAKPLRGWSEKFFCRLPDGRVFKIKYVEGDRFKEVYGEVLGTRLFWALGFYTDRILPVRVTCRGCPKHPWAWVNAGHLPHRFEAEGSLPPLPPEAEVGTWTFDPAALEELFDGAPIEERPNQGWTWRSLDQVDPSAGGATRADVDALKLLAAFVQCADNSAEQNVLTCPRDQIARDASGDPFCRRPILYVGDLGAVFGRGGLTTAYGGRVDYDAWAGLPVWRDAATCTARLNGIGGPLRTSTLRHPVVGEGGRALLASLLSRLSDRQIADLFRAARIDRLRQTTSDGRGGRREVTIDDWVTLFKRKREEITLHPGCPEP
jgi:hypothetical protein